MSCEIRGRDGPVSPTRLRTAPAHDAAPASVRQAARGLLAFGFETLGLHRIAATCDTGNVGSARVLEKIGMRREALFREDSLLRGRWRDSFLYAVLEHEWKGGTP